MITNEMSHPDKRMNHPEEPRKELGTVLALLLAIFIFNLMTAMAYPKVWSDEAMYSDPAANWALGKGFVSGSWYVQTSDQFWAGNAPLHEIILGGWIRLFGFSPLAVRSLDYLWFVSGTFLVWWFCVRTRWVNDARLRLLLVFLLACESGISFSYRSGRPDMLGYFLCSAALAAATIDRAAIRFTVLAGLGLFFPWAAIQLLPLLVILAVLLFLFFGHRVALNVIVVGMGAGAGLLALYAFFQAHHVWNDFVASVKWHASGPQAQVYRHAQLGAVPGVFLRDPSVPFLLALCLLAAWRARTLGDRTMSRAALFALAAGGAIPVCFHFIGVFPIYYFWMAALPMALGLWGAWNLQPTLSSWTKMTAIGLFAMAVAVGLPSRLVIAAFCRDAAPYTAADRFITDRLKATDRVYIDYSAFYPAMRSAKKVFTLRYFQNAVTADEKRSINVLVVAPPNVTGMTNALPGDWRFEGEYDGSTERSWLPRSVASHLRDSTAYAPYHYVIYRREIENSP